MWGTQKATQKTRPNSAEEVNMKTAGKELKTDS